MENVVLHLTILFKKKKKVGAGEPAVIHNKFSMKINFFGNSLRQIGCSRI